MNELEIPKDIEAEQAVLGSIIFNNTIFADVASILKPNQFYSESHRYIFAAMQELYICDSPIDEILLADELKAKDRLEEIGGIVYLAELVECVPITANIIYYARIIEEHAIARDLITVSNTISKKSRNPEQNIADLLQEAQKKIAEIAVKTNKKTYRHIKDILHDNFQRLEELSESKEEITGLKTGFDDIDKMTAGLQPADLVVVAARPAMGKTAFALNIGSYVARTQPDEGAVLVFSLEMLDTQLGFRLLSGDARINSKCFKSGNLEQEDWDKLAMSTDTLSEIPLYINDSSKISPYEMVTITKQLDSELENGVSLAIVDYLQLAQGKGNPAHREQEIANISRTLKGLAKDLKIPVVALSQLNRTLENRSDKRPILADLRESGAIEQDADVVLCLYRDEVYYKDSEQKGVAEAIFRKHRNGPTGTIYLRFDGKYTSFYNLNKNDIPDPQPKKRKWKPKPEYKR